MQLLQKYFKSLTCNGTDTDNVVKLLLRNSSSQSWVCWRKH